MSLDELDLQDPAMSECCTSLSMAHIEVLCTNLFASI
jgi:hypothetical protein